jgi:hypothetical protein
VEDGWIHLTDAPGFGIESLNDDVLKEHLTPGSPGIWMPTDEWDDWYSSDSLWS